MQRLSVKTLFILLLVLIFLAGCKENTQLVSYIKHLNKDQIDVFYTNDIFPLQKKLSDFNMQALPQDLTFVKPYNTVVLLWDTLVDSRKIDSLFPFAQVKSYKKAIIIDNSFSDVDIEGFFKDYARRVKLPQLVFTNGEKTLKKIAPGYDIKSIAVKCKGDPCRPNSGFKQSIRSQSIQVNEGKAFVVYYFDTDTSKYPGIDEIKKYFSTSNIIKLKDGFIILPVFFFSTAMLDSLKGILRTDTNITRVLTNRTFIKKFLPQDKRVLWLPQKRQGKEQFTKSMNNIKGLFDRDRAVILYFYPSDEKNNIFPSQEDLQKFFGSHIFYEFPQGVLIRSKYYKIPAIVDSLKARLRSDSLVYRVYTNKVYLLKSFLEGDTSIKVSVVWEPHKCTLKDTICYPTKDFYTRMFRYKLDVEARKAMWLHFNDPSQKVFPQTDFLKEYLANSFDTETDEGVLFSSPYINSPTFKALKEQIIPIYYNPDFKIYSNKVYILKYLLDPSYTYYHLPVQFILPSYERNEKLELQLQKVKQEIIVNYAILVYLKDPTDSIYPSEQYIRERFKYLKFYNFKDGFVIGAYLGD